MVMVSIKFATLNRGLRGNSRPTGFPHAHPRISNILGHGSKLMAISLLPWPKPRLGPRPRQWPQAQCHGHGPGPKLVVARKGSGSWHQARGNVPKPQATARTANYATYLLYLLYLLTYLLYLLYLLTYLQVCSPQPRVKRQLPAHSLPPRAPLDI